MVGQMKYFPDGDQLCITKDDFENLQESPALFVPLDGEMARTIISAGFRGLPVGDLQYIRTALEADAHRMGKEQECSAQR